MLSVGTAATRRRGVRARLLAVTAFIVVTLGAQAAPALARPGDTDPSWATNGIVTDPTTGESAAAVALQPDGKVVVAGKAFNGVDYDFLIARYTTAGVLDSAFGSGSGKVTIGFQPTSNDFALALALQLDGRIVAVGVTNGGTTGRNEIGVVRLNTDGTLDAGFNAGGSRPGTRTTAIAGSFSDRASAVTIDAGRIVVAGQTFNGTDDDFAVVRYSSLGVPDSSFGSGGIVTTAVGTGNDRAYGIATYPGGMVVVVGETFGATDSDFAVVRYTSIGGLDPSFGSAGIVKTATGSGDDIAQTVAVAGTSVVVAGSSFNGTDDDFEVVKYLAGGSLDGSFNTTGKVRTAFGGAAGARDVAQAIAIQNDGRILVAGYSRSLTDKNIALARYSGTNGALDTTFGTAGTMTTGGSNDDDSFGVAVQPDSKIVAAGVFDKGVNSSLAVLRLLGETVTVGDAADLVSNSSFTFVPFTINLAVQQPNPVTVRAFTSDGSARAFVEYVPLNQFVTIPANATSATIFVPIYPNGAIKPDQTFFMNIDFAGVANPTNASILRGQAVATLLNHHARSYWLAASDGGVFAFGAAQFYGSTGGIRLNRPIVGMAVTPTGLGYWLVASDGGVFGFGDAQFYGSTGGIRLNQPIVGIASSPSGHGYWLVASDGGIFAFGDAQFRGSTGGIRLNRPIVGIAADPNIGSNGYWLVGSDGGIFAFNVPFFGSTGGIRLNSSIVGIGASPAGSGYWLVGADGGIFAFNVGYFGSTGGIALAQPVVGMTATGSRTNPGSGYFLAARDGGVFAFGDAEFQGSAAGIGLNPIVGIASR